MSATATVAKERLILCSGPYVCEGFKTLDANPEFKPDYCVLLPPLPREMRNGRWDEIYLIHGIEHFAIWEAVELLPQIHEALVPGGLLVLEQPNLEVAAKVFLGLMPPMTADPLASGIKAIYGDPRFGNPLMGHKWGWTPSSLTGALIDAGFSSERIKVGEALSRKGFADGRDFRIEATK